MVKIILEKITIRQKRKNFHRIILPGRWQIPQHGHLQDSAGQNAELSCLNCTFANKGWNR